MQTYEKQISHINHYQIMTNEICDVMTTSLDRYVDTCDNNVMKKCFLSTYPIHLVWYTECLFTLYL